jgi:hypothetical protein
MYPSFKKIISLSVLPISYLAFPFPALAQTGRAWSGKCLGTGLADDVATIQGLECLFYNILQVIVAFAGLAFFIMFIIGGFKYLTGGGDDKKTAAAASTLTMAVIGLVGIIISWFILRIIQRFTGVDVTHFIIPG